MASNDFSRRRFIGSAAAVTAGFHPLAGLGQEAPADNPRIKIGLIGGGGRGSWIAGLFKKHGGYQFHAVADYFPAVAERAGTALGVGRARCFSGLSGFRKLIESGVEAVVIETPPYFMPEHPPLLLPPDCTSIWPSPWLWMCPAASPLG